MTEFNGYIANVGAVETHFSAKEPMEPQGEILTVKKCAKCHGDSGERRGPLYRAHRNSIKELVDGGAMPPNSRLSDAELAELRKWLGE
jgi:mono/diheme cytochrome c family protein